MTDERGPALNMEHNPPLGGKGMVCGGEPLLAPLACHRCDFGTGRRGMDRCHACDGTGSVLSARGTYYPNTRAGYDAAVAALRARAGSGR